MNHRTLPAVLFSAFLFLPLSLCGAALDVWHWRNPLPTGNNFKAIAFGGGTFMTVDDYGGILRSSDGVAWTVQPSPAQSSLNAITYGNGRFVAVGEAGVVVSSEGGGWAARSSGTTQSLASVTYGNGWFVAVGNGGIIIRSSDGVTWTPQNSSTTINQLSVAFGDGIFVAVGGDYATRGTNALVSVDGMTWTPHLIFSSAFQNYGLIHAFGKFYVTTTYFVGGPGGGIGSYTYTSTNGVDWVRDLTTPRPSSSASGAGVVAMTTTLTSFGAFVPAGLVTSTDGVNWVQQTLPSGALLRSVAHGNGLFVAVGDAGDVVRSTNGMDWVRSSIGDRGFSVNAGAYGDGKYVLVGQTIVTSSDGVTFNRIDDVASGLRGVTYGNGKLVAVGGLGVIVRSSNGFNWLPSRSGTSRPLRSIAYGAGKYVVVGETGTIRVSEDGANWNGVWSGTDYSLRSVVYGADKFVAVGDFGIVLRSMDGLTWAVQRNDDFVTLEGVTYGNGRFVAVGAGGTVMMADLEASTWTRQDSGITAGLQNVSFGGGLYIAGTGSYDVAAAGLFSSIDGEHWVQQRYGTIRPLGGTAFLNNTFMLFGPGGIVLQSDPLGAMVLSAAGSPGTSEVQVTISGGEMGRTYRLQACHDLSLMSWGDVATFIQTQYVTRIVVPAPSASQQNYYRAISP